MALAVGVPILLKLRFPEVPGPMAKATFDAVESIPEGSRVLLSFDYDPASAGELQPMANALVYHCASRHHRIVFMALWPLGKQMADKTIKDVLLEFHHEYKYGVDYVQLGYKAGNEGVIKLMTTNIPGQYPTDADGAALSKMPIVADAADLRAFKFIGSFSAGFPGAKEWVQYAKGNTPDAFKVVGGSTGVQVSQLLPYYPKQMEGLLVAIKGAAEYEMLVTSKYPPSQHADRLEEGRRQPRPRWVAGRCGAPRQCRSSPACECLKTPGRAAVRAPAPAPPGRCAPGPAPRCGRPPRAAGRRAARAAGARHRPR